MLLKSSASDSPPPPSLPPPPPQPQPQHTAAAPSCCSVWPARPKTAFLVFLETLVSLQNLRCLVSLFGSHGLTSDLYQSYNAYAPTHRVWLATVRRARTSVASHAQPSSRGRNSPTGDLYRRLSLVVEPTLCSLVCPLRARFEASCAARTARSLNSLAARPQVRVGRRPTHQKRCGTPVRRTHRSARLETGCCAACIWRRGTPASGEFSYSSRMQSSGASRWAAGAWAAGAHGRRNCPIGRPRSGRSWAGCAARTSPCGGSTAQGGHRTPPAIPG